MLEVAGGILIAVAVLIALPLILFLVVKIVRHLGVLILAILGGFLLLGSVFLGLALMTSVTSVVGGLLGFGFLAACAFILSDPMAYSNWSTMSRLPEEASSPPPPMPKRGTAEYLQWANREGPWAER